MSKQTDDTIRKDSHEGLANQSIGTSRRPAGSPPGSPPDRRSKREGPVGTPGGTPIEDQQAPRK